MDEGKVDAVISWPEPGNGFANFYRRFIKGYSQITSSLTNFLKGHQKALIWTSEASTAFQTLKQAFTQAPLLTHPDPDLPFVVEVYASTTGVGAVLSQYHGTPARLHPCAYFSRKLSPAETNYDIGNRELLAIKLALEESTSPPRSLSSGYHPQTNGQTERKIQEVGRFLWTFCHVHQNSWNQFLGWAEYTQNSLRQPSTGLTPFQCVLGFQPPLFPWNGEPSDVPAVDHWFRESERVWDTVHHHLQRAVHRTKAVTSRRRIPGPTFTPGQKVWLSTRDIRLCLPSKKLSPRFVGPFTILEQVNPVTYKLQLPPQYRIHPTFHVSLLKPCHEPLLPSTEPGHEEEPPPPMVLEEGSIYSVKEILMSWRRGGHLEYLVDWESFGPEERSWVPRDDILDPTLTDEFHAAHPEYPAP
ncbi:Transposon Tf2-9 polyprotein [Labeo rohita]|uniref:Transposon Tf2-9 polyprotein n=1 Tax=Labeo rohita TaxID=84645 RepID=A0ABQ8MW36_LABRO|nr:Transposon Tf2-9 polyprotein [Labeo rohita]